EEHSTVDSRGGEYGSDGAQCDVGECSAVEVVQGAALVAWVPQQVVVSGACDQDHCAGVARDVTAECARVPDDVTQRRAGCAQPPECGGVEAEGDEVIVGGQGPGLAGSGEPEERLVMGRVGREVPHFGGAGVVRRCECGAIRVEGEPGDRLGQPG